MRPIDTTDISANAGILGTQIADNTIQQRNIENASITSGQINLTTISGPHAIVSADDIEGDYANIQSAIDYVNGLGGGEIFIRNGTYLLSDDITVYSNITLIGETAGGVILDFQNEPNQIKHSGSLVNSSGTVAINNDSLNVTGTGTSFASSMVGEYILLSGRWYLIDVVTNSTHLTVDQPFDSSSITGYGTVIATVASNATLQDFTVQNSTDSDGAIFIQYALAPTIDTVTVLGSTIGINSKETNSVNYLNFSCISCGTGVNMENSAVGTFYNFYVYASTGTNLVFTDVPNLSVSNATVSSAGGNNFTLTRCSGWGLYDMENTTATGKGIELITCSDIEIFAMVAHFNGSDGIKLTSNNTRITIHNVSLVSNTGYGINIAAASDNSTIITACGFSSNTAGSLNDSGTSTFKASNTPDNSTNNSPITSATKWATARLLANNSVDGSANVAFANKFIVQGTTDSGLSAAQFLGALSTGIVKVTTTTGVLSVAINSDLPAMSATVGGAVPTPPNNTTTFLRGDATWATPSGAGDVSSNTATSVDSEIALFSSTTGKIIKRATGSGIAKITSGVLSTATNADLPSGTVIQELTALYANTASGSTTLPADNTVPQSTEGDEYMSITITPTNANNTLIIEAKLNFSLSGGAGNSGAMALFADGGGSAYAATLFTVAGANFVHEMTLRHAITGSLSIPTTWKIRAGRVAAGGGTFTFNGAFFGGITQSSMTIKEVKV